MTSYSRIYYEAYEVETGWALDEPTTFASARTLAQLETKAGRESAVRFHHADRLTKNCPPEGPVPARHDGEGGARISGGPIPFFDDEISRAICTTEEVGPA